MATRCFCPPDSVETCRVMNSSGSRFTAASAARTRAFTSFPLMFGYLQLSENATSLPTVGMMTWWSGFWNTNARGAWTLSRPLHGVTSPAKVRSSVDLPQPLGPRSMNIDPRGTRRLTPWSASVDLGSLGSPYLTYRSSHSTP
mmetsp:Transcript_1579/g.6385  ORF Transcript_1579/g.6385 Transcript_1579/m.6385 type:complete len:143 (+) Transcript_1579:245-673(+)